MCKHAAGHSEPAAAPPPAHHHTQAQALPPTHLPHTVLLLLYLRRVREPLTRRRSACYVRNGIVRMRAGQSAKPQITEKMQHMTKKRGKAPQNCRFCTAKTSAARHTMQCDARMILAQHIGDGHRCRPPWGHPARGKAQRAGTGAPLKYIRHTSCHTKPRWCSCKRKSPAPHIARCMYCTACLPAHYHGGTSEALPRPSGM